MAASTPRETMNALSRLAYLVILYGLLAAFASGRESPRLEIRGGADQRSDEGFPLKSSQASVTIEGNIARVRLCQTYGNTGSRPVEAVYVFPASTGAAVHGMTLASGGRVTAARIRESVKAKAEYQEAKSDGKTAALLEEHRPNVFQMSVANLLPGDDIDVTVEWTETIRSRDGTSEFVFPTVVGPRYDSGSGESTSAAWAGNPHLAPGLKNPARFGIELSLTSALPLKEAICTSHPARVEFTSAHQAKVKLDSREGEEAANRDFILRWKLGGEEVDGGLLLHCGKDLNHFLLQIEPPARVTPEKLPPRDYVLILDVSGSMDGFPLDTAKKLLTDLVGGLKEGDTFNVVCFASGSGLLSETPLAATPGNLEAARSFIDNQSAGGGTELLGALQRSLALPGHEDRSRTLVLVTDGYITADDEATRLIRSHIGRANLFSFGIGSSVNRHLIESIARAGQGEPVIVTTRSAAGPAARDFLDKISNPVLAQIRIEGEGIELRQLTPHPVADLFADCPLVVSGTWSGEARGRIIVRGVAGGGRAFVKAVDLSEAAARTGTDHPALPVLWAREQVRGLLEGSDRSASVIAEVTRLGLEHSLLTPYTSFVAIDETPRPPAGDSVTVRQPLPLPAGVGASASSNLVGGPLIKGGSVPEPGAIGLVSLLVVLLALQRRR